MVEFRAIFGADVLSLVGDWLAKVALTVLVFQRTGSTLLAAITFGISYLPWVLGGPVLTAFADRFSRRQVMIACDVFRAALVGLMALPGIPLAVLIGLLFITELCAPPFNSARSALLPEILRGDRYVVGNGLTHIAAQGAQVAGFLLGGLALAFVSARTALLVDAATFALSAIVLAIWIVERPAPADARAHTLMSDAKEGIRFVLARPTLRSFVFLAWAGAAVGAAPEALAAPYAHNHHATTAAAGWFLAANPLGYFLGALVVGRWLTPRRRTASVRPLALLACLALVPVVLDPPFPVLLLMLFLAGVGGTFNLALNQLFVQAVPERLRARAFGVAASGLMIFQGAATFAAGAAAEQVRPYLVIAACGVIGLLVVGALSLTWPRELVLHYEDPVEASALDTPLEAEA